MTDDLRKAGVLFLRVTQGVLLTLAVALAVGTLASGMNVIQAMFVGVAVLVLLGFFGVFHVAAGYVGGGV